MTREATVGAALRRRKESPLPVPGRKASCRERGIVMRMERTAKSEAMRDRRWRVFLIAMGWCI